MTYQIINSTEREDNRVCYEYTIYSGSKIYKKGQWLIEEGEDIDVVLQVLTRDAEIEKSREGQPA